MRSEAGVLVDNRDFCAEPAKHVCELEADISAPNDEQVGRHGFKIEDGGAGQEGDRIHSGHIRHQGARAHVEEDMLRFNEIIIDTQDMGRLEHGCSGQDGTIRRAPEPLFDPGAGLQNDPILAGFDGSHVNGDCTCVNAEIAAAARQMSGMRAGDHRFCWRAPGIDAGTAKELPLNERNFPTRTCEADGQRRSGLPGTHYDCVIGLLHRTLNKKTIARPIAITSSSRAAGKSRPNAAASLARIAAPPRVPNTDPIAPGNIPSHSDPPAAPIVAPVRAPLRSRAMNWGGVFRLGVFGNLSLMISPIARTVRIIGVYLKPMKASGELATARDPLRANQLATAGAVKVRNPETIPTRNAHRSSILPPSSTTRIRPGWALALGFPKCYRLGWPST